MPLVFAGDPAPQQLTAPCRKYQAALHHPIEQPVYRIRHRAFRRFSPCFHGFSYSRAYGFVDVITKLIAAALVLLPAVTLAQNSTATATVKGAVVDARTGSPLPRILVAIDGGPSLDRHENPRERAAAPRIDDDPLDRRRRPVLC